MSYIHFNLPKELNEYIKSFLKMKCCECSHIYYSDNHILKNITTIYTNQYFNDDFPFPQYYKTYNILCITCKIKLGKKGIGIL